MHMVYIASQYTCGDQEANVRRQLDAADVLMSAGICPIVPLLTHYQHMHKPRPYEDWMAIDLAKVDRCDGMLRLPGYSPGADREVARAEALGLRVVYSEAEAVRVWGTLNVKGEVCE